MEDLSVKELAEELNITKQAIHKKIARLPTELTPNKINGAYRLSPEIVDFIKNSTNEKPTDNQQNNQRVEGEVVALKMLIEELKEEKKKLYKQLDQKDSQLHQVQKLVDQQQQLTLQANRQNERLQLQLNQFKKEEKEKHEEEDNKIEEKKEKKWWYFWT